MGMENPVGKFITLWEQETEIIGLVKDFNFQSLRQEVEPLFFRLAPEYTWRAYVRVSNSDIQNTIASIENVYKKFNPMYPFDYEFMDEQYAALYRSEQRIGDLAKYFSIFAILISCLGLFGLSAFTAEQRAKEIGVRKVLGASVQNLVLLLTKDFTKPVLFAIMIAIPVSWWMMDSWLSGFAYQSGLEWWIFAASGILAVVVAWLTVSWQSIKAAWANPVDSLKSE
jgi:ABC-type antimicrobial peptide transport system permease subunit